EGEEHLLRERAVAGQVGCRWCAGLPAEAGREAQAERRQRGPTQPHERAQQYPAGHVLVVAVVAIAQAEVAGAVEDAGCVQQNPLPELARELYAQVAVRHQVAGWTVLHEGRAARRLEALESDGRPELAHGEHDLGARAHLDIGVVNHGLAATEVGHDSEAEPSSYDGIEYRPRAPNKERGRRNGRAVNVQSLVDLDVPAHVQAIVAVGGAQ